MLQARLVHTLRLVGITAVVVAVATLIWAAPSFDYPPTASAATTTVDVGNNWFCNSGFQGGTCETKINVGDTVVWDFDDPATTAPHTTTSTSTSLWDSGTLNSGTFQFTFDTPGTFEYQCNIHPSQMQGTIVVNGPPATETPFPTLPVPPSPEPTATETPIPTLLVPPSPGPTATETPSPEPTATETAVPTATGGMVGDVNDNGTVDSIDAVLVLQFNAGLLLDLANLANADTNQNGEVNAIDATLILQFVAGLLATLPP